MANSTVYPYGTGGTLPSSIGLVNDLTTGGVDKALTAQQGVVIKSLIDDARLPIEFSTVVEDGLFFVDLYNNIGFAITGDGCFGVGVPVIENV